MKRHRNSLTLLAACGLACAALAMSAPAHAGFADRIKKKLGDKVNDKVDKGADKVSGDTDASAAGKSPDGESGDAAGGAGATGAAGGGDNGTLTGVSTKFDYVPGDSVLFSDDFTQDELGEFPARWKLTQGTFETAEMQGERWLRCTSADGSVRMKLPPALPELWTLEFDFYCADPGGAIALTVDALTAGGQPAWQLRFPYSGNMLNFNSGSIQANMPVSGEINGRHHVMFLARGKAIKAYLDRERMANVPEYASADPATEIEFHLGAPSPPMITNVRFAEGPRPAKDMLATGKLVTYGIHFATGSDAVLSDSAPVLRQVAAYMEANAAVKLRITGHTDNVGTPASNLDLSKRRAASVAKALSTQLGIAADRFTTDGKGDTQALATNAKPEGRAMNRRVEFAKL